jgi:hypothetical protein
MTQRTTQRTLTAAAVAVVMTLVGVSWVSAESKQAEEELEFRLDHFKVYQVKEQEAGIRVELAGQFDREPKAAVLTRLTHFANPVSKNHEGIRDKNAHLTWYELEEKEGDSERDLVVRNQFGQQNFTIGRAVAFLAPALKRERESVFPWGLDHFKCYEVLDAPSFGNEVLLEDQFGTDQVAVWQARLFCVPAEKRIGERRYPIKNERDHLTFYEITPHEKVEERWVEDQFGRRSLVTLKSTLLGVPTLKLLKTRRCVDFENLAAGTTFTVGNTFNASGYPVEVKQFQWANGVWTSSGYAQIQGGGNAGASGNEVMANNVNLAFDFLGTITDLTVRFGEYGGNLNIEINGDFRNFANFADIHGTTIGGVGVSVVNGHGNDQGVLSFSGSIDSFAVGGQELWLDDLCPGSWNA